VHDIADVSDMKSGREEGKGGNEIDARIIEHPKEARKVVGSDIVQDKWIGIGCSKAVMAAHGTICKLFPEHRRFALEEKSGVSEFGSASSHTF
jgi:hypothetical protein